MQEVRNAVDQANREAATRFDFKGTDSSVELSDKELVLSSSTEDRLRALFQVLQEKLVRREVSLKAFEVGKIEEASQRRGPSAARHPRRHLVRPREEDQQVHQGPGPQRGELPDPRGAAAGDRKEARRPPVGDLLVQGGRLRDPAPVHQFPRLTRRPIRDHRRHDSVRRRPLSRRRPLRSSGCAPPARPRSTTARSPRQARVRPRTCATPDPGRPVRPNR